MAEQQPQEPAKGARYPTKIPSNSRSVSHSSLPPSASSLSASQKRWSRRQAAEAFLSSIPIGRDSGETSRSRNRTPIRDVTFGSPVRGSMKHSSSISSFLSTTTTAQDEEYVYPAIPGFRWSISHETQTSAKEVAFEHKEATDSGNVILLGGTEYETLSEPQEPVPRNERHGLSEDHPASTPSLPSMVLLSTETTENGKPSIDYIIQKGDLSSLKARLSNQHATCRALIGWKTGVSLLNLEGGTLKPSMSRVIETRFALDSSRLYRMQLCRSYHIPTSVQKI
jgi:hypothetical protein